jgi:Domain of unknown function (DUF5658)
MVCRMAGAALQAPVGSGGHIRMNRREGRRSCRPAPPVCWLLLLLFVLLQVADVVTTNYALAAPGVWEANPLMALMQAQFGAAWWLPKLAAVGFACLATPLLRRRWPLLLVVAYYSIVVSVNITHL